MTRFGCASWSVEYRKDVVVSNNEQEKVREWTKRSDLFQSVFEVFTSLAKMRLRKDELEDD